MFEDAANDNRWIKSMDDEIHVIEKNKTRELTDLPKGKCRLELNGCTKQNTSPMEKLKAIKEYL